MVRYFFFTLIQVVAHLDIYTRALSFFFPSYLQICYNIAGRQQARRQLSIDCKRQDIDTRNL